MKRKHKKHAAARTKANKPPDNRAASLSNSRCQFGNWRIPNDTYVKGVTEFPKRVD